MSESINVNGGQAGAVSGPSYFYEDEVFRVLRSGDLEFGMVTENWELYSTDSDESDEDRSTEKVPKGHVAVTWHPSGREDVIPEAKVQLSDRSLMPGDVVRKLIAGKDTQRGYARNVRVNAVVQTIGSKVVIPNISASSLTPVQPLHSDIAVYLDSWIGTVRDMRYRVALRFNDKSACTVDSYGIAEHFMDTRRCAEGFGNGEAFYPGQRLRGPMKYLRNADWTYCSEDLKRAKDRKLVTVIVTRVEPTGVSVQWQWQTPISEKEIAANKDKTGVMEEADNAEPTETGEPVIPNHEVKLPEFVKPSDCTRKPPPDLVTGEDMKRIRSLNLFDSCTVQLGDISFYTPSPTDTLVNKKIWKRESNIHIMDSHVGSKCLSCKDSAVRFDDKQNDSENDAYDTPAENESGNENDTNDTNNKVESLKKDGPPVSGAGTAKKSLPRVSTRALRKKKLKKARQPTTVTVNREKQLVVETIHTSSSVDVVWQDGTVEENMLSIDLYPIHHLDDHEFFPGDFIVRAESADPRVYGVIQRMDHNARVAVVRWFETYTSIGEQQPKQMDEEEMSVYDIKDHPDFRFRPGTIVFRIANLLPNQYPAGQILDNYPDGQVRVWWSNNVTSACWPQDLYRLGDYDSDGEIWDDDNNDNGDGASSDGSWETDNEEEQIGDNESPARRRSISAVENDAENLPESLSALTLEQENVKLMVSPSQRVSAVALSKLPQMEQFVMVETVPDGHRYRQTVFQPSNSRNFLKTIQREMSLLRENLPKGIIVKGFEDRMDLFSVLIHGPDNTPYEDGIFLFDIMLPSNYPDAPPLVHYVSFCSNRLNPNLYECGKVCVSLLGTWSGKGTEVWTAQSSLLQLLVSIQGLILVDEPYYNEAGYEKQRGSQQGEENSRMYNEMVLIKLVQAMSGMLTNPHAPWEKESTQHIRLHGPQMISRYRKWLSMSEGRDSSQTGSEVQAGSDGLMVSGIVNAEATVGDQPGFSLFPVSKGFAISLKKTLNKFENLCNAPITPSGSNTALTLDQAPVPTLPQISPVTTIDE